MASRQENISDYYKQAVADAEARLIEKVKTVKANKMN